MVQTQTAPTSARTATGALQLYLILYPKEIEDEVIGTLESAGVPGYTEMPKMIGRGRHMKHFNNPVWPGATGALFTVLTRAEAQSNLIPSFRALAAALESRSKGLYGLHMFALPCEQLI